MTIQRPLCARCDRRPVTLFLVCRSCRRGLAARASAGLAAPGGGPGVLSVGPALRRNLRRMGR